MDTPELVNRRFEDTLKRVTRDQLITTLCVVSENLARISGADFDDKERSLFSKEIVCGLIDKNSGVEHSLGHEAQNVALVSVLNTFGSSKGVCETWEEQQLRKIRQTLNFND